MLDALDSPQPLPVDPKKRRILRSLIHLYGGGVSKFLNFYGPTRTIPTIPFYRALTLGSTTDPGGPSPEEVAGKAVFVGSSESRQLSQKDGFYTVYTEENGVDLSGVEIAATAFANLVEDMPIRPLPYPYHVATLLAWTLGVGILSFAFRPAFAIPGVAALSLLYLGAAEYRFATAGVWYPVVFPLAIQGPIVLLGAVAWNYVDLQRQRKHFRRAFEQYLPADVVNELAENVSGLGVSNRLTNGICLATDAGQYTSLSESMDPKELADVMNRYYEAIFEPINRRGGMVSNIVGDSMLALWLSGRVDTAPMVDACGAAIEIAIALRKFRQNLGKPALPTRIGLHTGEIFLGNIGGAQPFRIPPGRRHRQHGDKDRRDEQIPGNENTGFRGGVFRSQRLPDTGPGDVPACRKIQAGERARTDFPPRGIHSPATGLLRPVFGRGRGVPPSILGRGVPDIQRDAHNPWRRRSLALLPGPLRSVFTESARGFVGRGYPHEEQVDADREGGKRFPQGGRRMSKFRSLTGLGFIAAVVLATPHFSHEAVAETCERPVAVAVSVQGEVNARKGGAADWEPVRRKDAFCPGDAVRVMEQSRADLLLINETTLRLDQNTEIVFTAPERKKEFLLDVLFGGTYFMSRTPRTFKVHTPFVNAGIEGTEFFIGVEKDRALLTVFEGRVAAANDRGEVVVTGGQSVVAEAGRAPVLRTEARPARRGPVDAFLPRGGCDPSRRPVRLAGPCRKPSRRRQGRRGQCGDRRGPENGAGQRRMRFPCRRSSRSRRTRRKRPSTWRRRRSPRHRNRPPPWSPFPTRSRRISTWRAPLPPSGRR